MRTTTKINIEAVKRAFKALRKAGVVAHVASSGCHCCYVGHSEQAEKQQGAWGAAYLWRPDLDGRHSGTRGVYIKFGAVDGRGRTTEDVGREIVDRLRAEGVPTEWNGLASHAILVLGTVPPPLEETYQALATADRAIYAARGQADDAARAVGLYVLGVATAEPRGKFRQAATNLDTARQALLLACPEAVLAYYVDTRKAVADRCAEMVTLADRLNAAADYGVRA